MKNTQSFCLFVDFGNNWIELNYIKKLYLFAFILLLIIINKLKLWKIITTSVDFLSGESEKENTEKERNHKITIRRRNQWAITGIPRTIATQNTTKRVLFWLWIWWRRCFVRRYVNVYEWCNGIFHSKWNNTRERERGGREREWKFFFV